MVTKLPYYPAEGGRMIEIYIGIMTFVVVVLAVIVTLVLLELRRDLGMIMRTIKQIEESLLPVLQELQKSLESVRHVTDNVGIVTEDMKTLSGSMKRFGENVRQISDIMKGVTGSGAISVAGLKMGVKAAFIYFLKNFLKVRKIN
ncbi:MAG: hypothetical protein LBQ00_03790 [Syntrophobacterales bacterium]|jgi:uncharacterized protein YoxC|nr:hypothetical protein [Syntrophobacterales bacterium]